MKIKTWFSIALLTQIASSQAQELPLEKEALIDQHPIISQISQLEAKNSSQFGPFSDLLIKIIINSLLPDGWKGMEIEAKWKANTEVYQAMLAAFPEDSYDYGYRMNVRWKGISRQFEDVYYDDDNFTLTKAGHPLRHRTRYTSSPLAADNSVESLNVAAWREDWQKIQYKSTPYLLGPVWLRHEANDCKISDRKNEELCAETDINAEDVIYGAVEGDVAIAKLKEDHPNFDLYSLHPVMNVHDYRYRVEFIKESENIIETEQGPVTEIVEEEMFELSLDRVTSTILHSGEILSSHEAELEIIKQDFDEETIVEFFALVAKLQIRFGLTPSEANKGDLIID